MVKRKLLLFLLPLVTLTAGIAVVLIGYVDYRKEVRDIEQLFEAHVDSVAALITEGAREASTSTSLIYEISEGHLAGIAHILSASNVDQENDLDRLLFAHGITVRLDTPKTGPATGVWGPVTQERRAQFLDWMREAPENLLIDDGLLAALDIACLRYNDSLKSGIVCVDADRLAALRREIGIGPLLGGIIQKDVRYAALQDAEGLLAAAPPNARLSRWQDDPTLRNVWKQRPKEGAARLIHPFGAPIFEGLVPFQMADDSWVVLRVGIDATVLEEIQAQAEKRLAVTLTLVGAVSLATAFLSFLLYLRVRRTETMEARLRSQEEERRHWEMIGQMAATVAHEVRNPLNTLGMTAQRLKHEFSVSESERAEYRELIEMLLSESERVGRVVTEFLDLGKPLKLDLREESVKAAIDTALFPLHMRAEKEGKILTGTHTEGMTAFLDAELFRRMLSNVVENALDAVPVGGIVDVQSFKQESDIRIDIRDNGPGMSPEKLKEVQKPFVSFKKTGTGLGLPLVQRIAAAHGGSLHLTSSEGDGTTATLKIPSKSRTNASRKRNQDG